jgi:hypothetical protein
LAREDIFATLKGLRSPIPLDDAVNQWWLGTRTEAQAKQELSWHGYGQPGDWERVTSVVSPFNPSTAVDMWFKGKLPYIDLLNHLGAAGYNKPEWRDGFIDAQRMIPSPERIVNFAVREVWDPVTVARLGYDEEFPEPLRYWLAKQGGDWGEPVPMVAGGAPVQVTWPVAYWRAHWQTMSPGQAYDAAHRLRPDRIGRYQGIVPGVQPFLPSDVDRFLKIADYPPTVRKWLAALAYRPIDLRVIRQGYTLGVLPRIDAQAYLQDIGYHPQDTPVQLDTWDAQARDKLGASVRNFVNGTALAVIREILAGYEEGIIDRATALQRMNQVATHPVEWSRRLDLIDSIRLRRSVREYLRALKAEYLRGGMSAAELETRLAASGIPPAGQSYYANSWAAQLTLRRRMLSTAQLLKALQDGIIDEPTATARLANLGWVAGDILIQVAGVQQRINSAQQKALAQQGKARAAAAKALAAAAKQASQARAQAIRLLRQTYPKSEMKRWLKEGIVGPKWVAAMLARQQYPPDYIQAFIEDAEYVKPTKPAKAAQGGKAPPPAGGTTPNAPGPTGP